ncbi:MAG: 1-acyl-sn-glycerol-3-phosphate acyltransferase [Candidatus Midichloriaceae bacterium]|jgi:1-acyl-sn-glycerol-3-phosphate acyltransferase
MTLFLRSLLFYLFIIIWTISITSLLSPLVFFKNTKVMSILGIVWSRVFINSLRIICNIKITVKGKENIPKDPFIIASKHQSVIETVFYLQYLHYPVYVIKKELLKIPFYGWFLVNMGMIPVDRSGNISALKKMLKDCEKFINEKRSVIIFPEGTRVKPFQSKDYHPGIVALRNKFSQIPILPVALNAGLFWKKSSFIKYPGNIIIEFLPVINNKSNNKEFLQSLKQIIDDNSDKLCKLSKNKL